MESSLKIRQLVFDEQGLVFIIQSKGSGEYFHCPVLDLFFNDHLLAEFNLSDIRLISYFAAAQEHELDRNFLLKLKRTKERSR